MINTYEKLKKLTADLHAIEQELYINFYKDSLREPLPDLLPQEQQLLLESEECASFLACTLVIYAKESESLNNCLDVNMLLKRQLDKLELVKHEMHNISLPSTIQDVVHLSLSGSLEIVSKQIAEFFAGGRKKLRRQVRPRMPKHE